MVWENLSFRFAGVRENGAPEAVGPELGELSILWDIATSPPIDLVGQETEIPAELWWNCGLRNWNFIFSIR